MSIWSTKSIYIKNSVVRLLVFFLSALLFFSFTNLIAQNTNRKTELQNLARQHLLHKLDQYLTDYYQARNIASVTAGVLHKGKIIWIGSRGFADLGNKVPAKPNTIYRVASISKVITAVAVMQLVEKGKINLDADARNYIPYFPKKKWKFTTRQILQHTAGLRTYRTGEFNSTVEYSSTREAVDVISKDPLEYKPGTKYLYTTLGYNLLAAIIENTSGLSFNEYLKKNIFIPSGMLSTRLEVHKEIIPDKAKGYDKNLYRKLQNAPLADLSIKYAGGGIISDAEDILKFADSLIRGKLLQPAYLDSMLVPARLQNGKTLTSGLGFEFNKDKDKDYFFGHYGYGTGFVSLLAIFPKDSVAVVHLINTADRGIESPALDLASIVMGKEYSLPVKSLADKMMELTLRTGIDSATNYYTAIKTDSANVYDLSTNEINTFGYDLLRIKKDDEGIKWFRLFAEDFPNSTSAFIGLGDAYYNDNNIGMALKAYRKAMALDGNNKYALKMIKLLDRR